MAKKKVPVIDGRKSVQIFAIDIEGNRRKTVRYERIEYSDGTTKEKGLPAGCKPNPTIEELFEASLLPAAKPFTRKGRKHAE